MGRKKKDDKAKGETRRRIEEGIQNFENLTVRFTSIQDKFGKALQASLQSTQLLRYAGDELIKEGEQIQGTSDTFYLGEWMKKIGKQVKQANEMLHTLNQSINDSFLGFTEKIGKEDLPALKIVKKNFDKHCQHYDASKTKLESELQKKKAQEKKILELQQETELQKQIKDSTKKGILTEYESVEKKFYCDTTFALMDITDKFNSYFEEGGRLFKRAQFDMNVGKDEFEKYLDKNNDEKPQTRMRASSRADTDKPEVKLRTSKRTSEILSPRTKSRREKVRHSLKIIQAHKQRYLKELEQCKDPILALLLTAVFEENVYQQTITDLTRIFQNPLRTESMWKSKISNDEIDTIFSNVNDIQRVHLTIHEKLRTCQEKWPEVSFCKTIYEIIDLLRVYLPYLSNYNTSQAHVEIISRRSKHLSAFFQNTESPLNDMLHAPKDIFVSYENLIEKLKPLLTNEEDKKIIENASCLLAQYESTVRESQTDKTSVLQLLEYQDATIGYDGDDLSIIPKRKVLKEGAITLQVDSPDEEAISPKGKHYIMLCNDMLVVSKKMKKNEVKGKRYKHLFILNLNQVTLEENSSEKYSFNLLEEETGDIAKEVSIYCRGKEEYQDWKTAFEFALGFVTQSKVIGVPLDDLMNSEQEKGNTVPSIIEKITHYLISSGQLSKEGLIRVSANASDIMELTKQINTGKIDEFTDTDPHLVISILKKFFRELPDSIFTKAKFKDFVETEDLNDDKEKLEKYKQLITSLPEYNQYILQHVFSFFGLLASYEKENKMNSYNIAVVMSPIMLPPPVMDLSAMALQNQTICVIQALIDNSKYVFAEIKEKRLKVQEEAKKKKK